MVWEGDSINKLIPHRDLPWLNSDSTQAKDLQRFEWFATGFIAQDPNNELLIGDIRYSLKPHLFESFWHIELDKDNQDQHVKYIDTERGDLNDAFKNLFDMIME